MNENSLDNLNLPTENELDTINKNFYKLEDEGLKNTLKHFDRIHDKLFSYNNILIAGYFALSRFENSISKALILIPLINMAFLFYIELKMLTKSRFEASITKQPLIKIYTYGSNIKKTNILSLLSILTTSFVTILFVYYILK